MPKTKQSDDIEQLKVNVALMQQDMKYQSRTVGQLNTKIDSMAVTIQNLKYVPVDLYSQQYNELKSQIKDLMDYREANDTGVRFINKITSNLLTTLASVAAIGLLALAAYNIIRGTL